MIGERFRHVDQPALEVDLVFWCPNFAVIRPVTKGPPGPEVVVAVDEFRASYVSTTWDEDPDAYAFEQAAAAERAYEAHLESPDPDYYADEHRAGR